MAATVSSANSSPPLTPLGYQLRLGSQGLPFDEMIPKGGGLRDHWRDVSTYFERLGPAEIGRRWNQARKILHDNGVAYNVQTQGLLRAWELNPMPLRLAGDDWTFLAKAVRQRARLLNHVLEDVYGPQKLLSDKLLPPSLVYGNAAFLRPCHGIAAPSGARLVIYAADLARSPDGSWWVISDRTQSPSGMGYTLENRLVLSRVFPEIFRETRIARLGGFFTKFGESLAALSPRQGTEPTVVLLTAGPLNETYFEQAYLARHLGCTLVQGQDLTVRDGRVYIKTLEGLRQVDVILRRVDEDFCDPLELRDDSLLGVPGLLAAVRAGKVAVANALGSGVVQSAALQAFLPNLSRKILGEDLLMPSVATWWCGEAPARNYALSNMHGLVIKDAFDYHGARPPEGLSRAKLREAVLARPQYFAAQENVLLSQCPDFVDGRLEARSVLLRVFAVRNGDDYDVLPGGLTRVAAEESSFSILLQQSGGSKDTWVDLAEEPLEGVTPNAAAPELRRGHLDLTSRVADNLFWLGRYAERSDFTARMVRCTLENFAEESGWVEQNDLVPMLRTLRHFDQFSGPAKKESVDRALSLQMADPARGGSLAWLLKNLQSLAATVRDQLSHDTWRILNQLGDSHKADVELSSNETALGLNNVILALSAFQGLLSENMPHGHSWRFLDLGRRIERGLYLSCLVRKMVEEKTRVGRLELLLETLDTLVTYRQKHTSLSVSAVLDLVLCDESNPRSLASQFAAGMEHLRSLPREEGGHFKLPEERRLLSVLSELRLLDLAETEGESRTEIVALLDRAEKALSDCSELVTLRFFTHLRTSSVGRDTASAELPVSL